ncbi:hypothetical protein SAMN05428947_101883 [Mucilaginibacter sp. OK283]|nr:hypothetical protein SAMN05428947_101883 [Mucilaginibacter sp. OK283]
MYVLTIIQKGRPPINIYQRPAFYFLYFNYIYPNRTKNSLSFSILIPDSCILILTTYQSSISRIRPRSSSDRKGISITPLPLAPTLRVTRELNLEARSSWIFCS